jgi:hypothetical protein
MGCRRHWRREEIDLARQTRRRLEERFDGRRFKERQLGASEAEPMGEIGGEFVAGKRCHVTADDNPLREGLVHGLATTPHRERLLWGGQKLSRIGALMARVGVVRACLALLTGGAPAAPRRFVRLFGPTAARTLERLVGEVRKLPPEVHPIVQALWCDPKCFHAMADHLAALERDRETIAAAIPPREVPLTGSDDEQQCHGRGSAQGGGVMERDATRFAATRWLGV